MSGSIHKLSSSLFFILLFYVPHVNSVLFRFPSSHKDTAQIINWQNDSSISRGAIELTKSTQGDHFGGSVGRAYYINPVRIWDKRTNELANFTTHFKFNITELPTSHTRHGDGFAFLLMPFSDSDAAPDHSAGGCLGLVGGKEPGICNITSYPFVAVEFDTYHNNRWDPGNSSDDSRSDHVGIDVNSIKSKAVWQVGGGLKNRTTSGNAWITYDSSNKNMSVYLTYDDPPVFKGGYNLSYSIDLTDVLPEKVRVGFSGSTGVDYERHTILSWNFTSTLGDEDIITPSNHSISTTPTPLIIDPTPGSNKATLVGGVVAGVSVLAIALGLFVWWRRRRSRGSTSNNNYDSPFIDDDFDEETGPKRFTYNELSRATNNFSEEGKLGEGGFGGVYRGFLADHNSREVAVKKISRGSQQGKKEYVSEVKTISLLRHKNLVQLIGWCHEQGNLLLVYEFMPNRSLESHLYANNENILPWAVRYNIVHNLASALLYLHQDWEQCVLHRDIKPSNVMLDSNFNAKLGDFGLARLVDHNLGSQTTVVAGTLGYLAPECFMTGKFSKHSDVYSFGVVALEVACGRKPIDESMEDPSKVKMIEWVWHLYGEGCILEAVDENLQGEFDTQQIECLMVIGLWCCHPDYTSRPSIRQVINVLNLESPLPSLPIKFPVPIYCSSQMNVNALHTSSSSSLSGLTDSSAATNLSSHSADNLIV